MDVLTFTYKILQIVICFLVVIIAIWRIDWLQKKLSPLLKAVGKGREIELQIFGQKVKFTQPDVEKNLGLLQVDINNLLPAEISSGIIPYTTLSEYERIVNKIQTLEVLNIRIEKIEDMSILKCIGGYYYLTGDLENSLKYYHLAEDISENLPRKDVGVYSNLGYVYFKFKAYDKANEYFQKAIEVDEECAWAYLGTGLVYETSLSKSEEHKEYYEIAIRKFSKKLETSTLDYLSYFGVAIAYSLMKKYEEAKEYLDRTIHIRPLFAPAFYNRGVVKMKLSLTYENKREDFLDDAIMDLLKALTLNPKIS